MNILILCTGNSARSIIAEVLMNDMSGTAIHAFSAGSHPLGAVNPHALTLLDNKAHDTSALRSKSWDTFSTADAPIVDVVITVCGNAASQACPVWPGAPIRVHWGFEDPAHIVDDIKAVDAFERTYALIRKRIADFLSLPLNKLEGKALQTAMQALAD